MIEGDNHHTGGEPKGGENLDIVVRATNTDGVIRAEEAAVIGRHCGQHTDEGLSVREEDTPARQSVAKTKRDTGAIVDTPVIKYYTPLTDGDVEESNYPMIRHCERNGDINYQVMRPDNGDMGFDMDKYMGVEVKCRPSKRSMKRCEDMLQKSDERCGAIGNTIRHILMDFPMMDEKFWLEQMVFNTNARKRVENQITMQF